MTPEQHQIERMRAWVAFAAEDADVQLADEMLAEFDTRFPAPKAESGLWTPFKPGDPMPCQPSDRVAVRLRNGVVLERVALTFDWRKLHDLPDIEIIAWRLLA